MKEYIFSYMLLMFLASMFEFFFCKIKKKQLIKHYKKLLKIQLVNQTKYSYIYVLIVLQKIDEIMARTQ